MASAAKRRKVGPSTAKPLTAPAYQRGIQAFGTISKSQIKLHGKSTLAKGSTTDNSNCKNDLSSRNAKKRKLESINNDPDKQENDITCCISNPGQLPEDGSRRATNISSSDVALQPPPKCAAQPITPRKRVRFAQITAETPTNGTRSRLETLTLPSSSPATSSPPSSSSPSSTAGYDTPPSSPLPIPNSSPTCDESNELPEELQDLINLHSSFLTALSLHHAHNGLMSPVDLRDLRPVVERVWRKRRVTTDDVRRILALEQTHCVNGQEESGSLFLSDYGNGKICVEFPDSKDAQKAPRWLVNQQTLNAIFSKNLDRQWTSYKSAPKSSRSPTDFIASIPLLPLTPLTSLSKLAPLRSKGQRRLEDLKAGAIRAQQRPLNNPSATATPAPNEKAKQTTTRSTDLLSRIKAKQLHQSTLPLPPSAETLARKAALQRLPEIMPVLESLAVSSKHHANDDAVAEIFKPKVAHVSFTMPTLVQHLQMSLRNPVGKDEAVRCVRLLAELMPGWITVRDVGKMVGVTVKGEGVDRGEMGRRIEGMVGRL